MWMLWCALAQPTDLGSAQDLYQQARYDEALAALPAPCGGAPDSVDAVACELLAASIQLALGASALAESAFLRLLSHDPYWVAPESQPPKVRQTLLDAKQRYLYVTSQEAKGERSPDGRVRFVVANERVTLSSVTMHLQRPDGSYLPLHMRAEGSDFVAAGDEQLVEDDVVHYHLELGLDGATMLRSGSDKAPRRLALTSVAAPTSASAPPAANKLPNPPPATSSWIWWAAGAAGAAALVGAGAGLYLWLGQDELGTVVVQVEFAQ